MKNFTSTFHDNTILLLISNIFFSYYFHLSCADLGACFWPHLSQQQKFQCFHENKCKKKLLSEILLFHGTLKVIESVTTQHPTGKGQEQGKVLELENSICHVFYSPSDDFCHSNAVQSNLSPLGLSDGIRSPGQPTLSLTSVGKNLHRLFTKMFCLCQLCAVAFMHSVSFV